MCMGYEDGWIGEAMCMFPWPDALAKARDGEEILRGRFKEVGFQAEKVRFDYVGINALHGPLAPIDESIDYNEMGLRVAAKVKTREEAILVRREVAHLWSTGALGVHTGVAIPPRQVVALWPTLVPREEITTSFHIEEVK